MASIPKFTSFKAKPKPQPAITSDADPSGRGRATRVGDDDVREAKSTSRRNRGGSRDRTRRPQDHRRARECGSSARRPSPTAADVRQPSASHEFEESRLVWVDRRGDAKNVEYGSLHRYTVPQYSRAGSGFLLGCPSLRIDRELSTEKELALHDVRGKPRRNPRALTSTRGKPKDSGFRLIAAGPARRGESDDDFIHFSSRRRHRESEPPEDSTIAPVDYRSIEGKAQASSAPPDEELEDAASDADAHEDADLIFRQQISVLSDRAKLNPTDLDVWLALAKHQAKLIRSEEFPDIESFTSSERRTLAVLRLSILGEASKHITKGRPDREALLLATIEEGHSLWDGSKLASKWQDALKECPTSILLWTRYLGYVQDNSSFSYEACKSSYTQCLRVLHDAQTRAVAQPGTPTGQTAIYVLLRLTSFLRDAGYGELAIATWQATLEYQFFMPAHLLCAEQEAQLAAFGEFWDNEVPRVGEENSTGWCNSIASASLAIRTPQANQRNGPASAKSLREVARQESACFGSLSLPATTDDDSVIDPFRHVMFSDIREHLVLIKLPPRLLLDAFHCFMGLPSMTAATNRDLMELDPHICGNIMTYLPMHAGRGKLRYRVETNYSLFEDGFELFAGLLRTWSRGDDGQARFVDRVLEAMVRAASQTQHDEELHESIAEYHIAFKTHFFEREARKLAKSLLRDRPSSLRLYNAYALAEYHMGDLKQSHMVWKTAMDMKQSIRSTTDLVLLWHSRLVTRLRCNEYALAVHELLDISGASGESTTPVGSAQLLKATRDLESRFDRAVLSHNYHHAAMYVDLHAWLTYLTADHDLSRAMTIYRHHDGVLSRQDKMSVAHELIYQYKAVMITRHLDGRGKYQPSMLRQDSEESLARFASNSILLELHHRLQSQDRLRSMFAEQTRDQPAATVVDWSHKISREMGRRKEHGTTSNAIRAMFTKALLGPESVVKQSPMLWMMWLDWELSLESHGRVKQVLLDGIRHLPWHKYWITEGMHRTQSTESELQQYYDVLIERGLRVRMDVE